MLGFPKRYPEYKRNLRAYPVPYNEYMPTQVSSAECRYWIDASKENRSLVTRPGIHPVNRSTYTVTYASNEQFGPTLNLTGLNNRPTYDFRSRRHLTTSTVPYTAAFTALWVVKLHGRLAEGGPITEYGPDLSSNYVGFYLWVYQTVPYLQCGVRGTSAIASLSQSTFSMADGSARVISVRNKGTGASITAQADMRVNGVSYFNGAGSAPGGGNGNNYLQMGKRNAVASTNLNMLLSEFMFFSGSASTDDLIRLEQSLARKWGITIPSL